MIHSTHEMIEADHGRLEQRRHLVCHDVGWLFSDRRYTDEPRFPQLAMIAMVETRTERSGRIEQENGPQNMAVIRHMALNMIRNAEDTHSLKVRRKKAALNNKYLASLLLRMQAP